MLACVYWVVPFFDCHTHHPRADADVVCISNVRIGYGLPPAQGAWSAGVHPWDAGHDDRLAVLEGLLAAPGIMAIGECGLDRRCDVPLDVQHTVFGRQIELSEQYGLPLIIHCVRAFDDLIALHRRRQPSMPWVVHGFNRTADLAQRLIDAGLLLSFGGALLRQGSSARDALIRVPEDRWLLETDDDADLRIADVYAAAADLLHVPVNDLCTIQQVNFAAVFKR